MGEVHPNYGVRMKKNLNARSARKFQRAANLGAEAPVPVPLTTEDRAGGVDGGFLEERTFRTNYS